ncbi:protein FAM32A [Strongylocentrotus purpuratus]|uniref:Protein FAM32A n=1 Tax=Strongylocentrotus purpuratus TaxID=7668 RepID=A0A7M7PL16_STRPU|nr:protein FAM32A [Strongylocentrotus purpuratus]XP_030852674.1 protein FAM32A [Strongylocentrotus purpuratus]|eukprot:XP_011663159.1 PREDICTED: protein FAM32A [Strongylocentrotus purpuratus]
MSAYSSAGGALKLKGGGDLGAKKKKKRKKESKKLEQVMTSLREEDEIEERQAKRDKRTKAQKAFDKTQEQRQLVRILDKASKKHKERVNEFNSKLDTLTEHFDIPKVSWTK